MVIKAEDESSGARLRKVVWFRFGLLLLAGKQGSQQLVLG
jgi:hypothetical protein